MFWTGLFHRVIADSGTGLDSWAAKENNTARGLQLARYLNCDVTTLSSALTCMKADDATAVLTAQAKVYYTLDTLKGDSKVIVFL